MVREVTTQRVADGGTKLPTERGEQIVVQNVSINAHMVHEFGDVSALSRQDEFGGCVVHSVDGRAQFVAGAARALICSRVPKAEPRAVVPCVRAEDDDSVANIGGVPTAELMNSLGRTQEPSGALGVAEDNAAPCGAKGGQGGVQCAKPPVEEHGPDKALPVIDEPFVANALLLKRSGKEVPHVRLTRISQDEGALDGAENIALLGAPISGEHATRGQSGDGVRLVLPLGPGGSLGEVGAQGGVSRH